MRQGLDIRVVRPDKGKNACELAGSCLYYKGTFEMPEEYREQYCCRNYRWCGRYLTYAALERERQTRFNPNQNELVESEK